MAALAGFVDATGFVAAGGYFMSFMSGNTTRLGVDLAVRAAEAIIPALLILGFVIGVVAGAIVAQASGRRRKTAVLGLASVLIVVAALAHSLGSARVFLGASVLAMGALNNAFSRDGEVAVGVTYMTGALVRFAQGLAARLMSQRSEGAGASLMLWSSLAAGAVAGASATSIIPALAPWLPVVAVLVLLLAAGRIERATC
jgi:uncharacterized membrane protein YoaK (UPF0700 family)